MGIEPQSSGRAESLTGLALTEWDRLAHGVKTLQLAVIKYGNVLNHKPHSVMAHQTHPAVGRGGGTGSLTSSGETAHIFSPGATPGGRPGYIPSPFEKWCNFWRYLSEGNSPQN